MRIFAILIFYMFALYYNLIPSIKFPDIKTNYISILASFSLIIILVFFLKHVRNFKFTRNFVLVGLISSILFIILSLIEKYFFSYMIFDILSSIVYILFVLFITPFFGVNLLIRLPIEIFAGIISLMYFGGLLIVYNLNINRLLDMIMLKLKFRKYKE